MKNKDSWSRFWKKVIEESSCRQSRAWAQKEYWNFNRKYFRGELPDVEIFFSRNCPYLKGKSKNLFERSSAGHTVCWGDGKITIILSSRLRGRSSSITLLHEMMHVRLFLISSKFAKHGPRFQREKRRLLLAGAYNDLV